jgi:hypothetical protein
MQGELGKVSLNAVKHGLTATTVVLPQQDALAFQKRVETWTGELAPRGKLGGYLAERVARISWQLDRADAHEQARLARRIESQGDALCVPSPSANDHAEEPYPRARVLESSIGTLTEHAAGVFTKKTSRG